MKRQQKQTAATRVARTLETPRREPMPEWAWTTPYGPEYTLIMDSHLDGQQEERLDLTRDEYVALKVHLAVLRGFDLTPPKDPREASQAVKDFIREVTFKEPANA